MFSNLSYQDKEGFFSLLDEYFASRPHLLQGGNAPSYNPTSPVAPVRSHSSSSGGGGGRTLPPPAPASSSRPPALTSPPPSAGAGGYGGYNEKPDMATRMVTSGFKMGASGARKGLGMLSKNQSAMDALGKAGAAGMMRHAQASLGPGKGGEEQQQQQQQQPTSPGASMTATRTTAVAPPPRRGGPTVVETTQVQVHSSGGQAKAVYDYSSGDSGDLSVQSGQVVNIVEKTSEDWWTCEDGSGRQGLVPASYLQQM